MLSTTLGLFALALTAFAHPGRDWQQQAKIKDATQECTYYNFEPLQHLIGSYPSIWEVADLQGAGITQDVKDLFAQLQPNIPKIAPRGTINGDWTGVSYDNSADPDCWWTNTGCTTPKLEGLPADITECNPALSWGFTLDDGPNCTHNEYYDYLESINQKATLFYIGSNVVDWPLEAQRGLADGHEICGHTWSHNYMTALTDEQAFAELYYTKKAIKDVVGVTVQCWRPPFGDTDDRIRWIAEQLGMRTVIWSDDTDDWNWVNVGKAAIEANYNDIIATAPKRPQGAIVLSHEINAGTMELSQEFLPQIQKTFTGGVMPVAVCMNNTEPYVEQGGQYVYPDYNQWMAGTTTVSLLAPTALSTSQSLTLTAASSARKPTTTPEASSPTTKAPSTSASVSSSYSSVGSSSLAQSSRSSSAPSAASDAQAASQSTGAPSSGSEKTTVSVGAAVLGLMGIILV